MSEQNIDLVVLTGDLVSAYVTNNSLPASELPALIGSVHAALVGLGAPSQNSAPAAAEVEKPTPAQVRKSISEDSLISFVDGKPYKTLKRHLSTHGLDPHSYRQRYGLPNDYPMVAPAYAAQRSQLARQIGLGRPGSLAKAEEAAPAPEPTQDAAPRARRGKASKADETQPEAGNDAATPRAAARSARKDPSRKAA